VDSVASKTHLDAQDGTLAGLTYVKLATGGGGNGTTCNGTTTRTSSEAALVAQGVLAEMRA
jgi:hypothetical protein